MKLAYEATWIAGEELWCSDCDAVRVHSDKPETGQFFCRFGHEWMPDTRTLGEWRQIIFAICSGCMKESAS